MDSPNAEIHTFDRCRWAQAQAKLTTERKAGWLEGWDAAVKALREEHERCFVQQHAVDKDAGELADMLAARRPKMDT